MLHPLEQNVWEFIRENRLIDPGDAILVAVSAGPDSMALLHVLYSLRSRLGIEKLVVAHFNHGLRGLDAAKDARLVERTATRLDLPSVVERGDTESHRRQHRLSVETAARELRHRFLQQSAKALGCNRIALGHSANDQAEEILLRLFRGVGPGGLRAMAVQTAGGIIRPLLTTERREILAYLQDLRLDYRIDKTNLDPFCRRNVVRLKILPEAEMAFSPQVVSILNRFAGLAAVEEEWWNQHLDQQWDRLCAGADETEVVLDIRALRAAHKAVRYRAIRRALEQVSGSCYGFGYKHIIAIERLAFTRASGRCLDLPRQIRAAREYHHLVLFQRQQEPQGFYWPITRPGHHTLGAFQVALEVLDAGQLPASLKTPPGGRTALLDADTLQWPLALRSRQPGDRFRPAGGAGHRKLKKYFNDRRIPRRHRDSLPLLCDQAKICWVVGHQLDDRVVLRADTKQVLRVTVDRIENN